MANTTTYNTTYNTTFSPVASDEEDIFGYSDEIDLINGIIMIFLTIFGIVENFSVFGAFVKFRRELNSRTNKFLTSLALSDGLMALIGAPMVTISALNRKWVFGDFGCQFYAFETYATGLSVIAHLTIISIDRMMAITSPIRYNSMAGNAGVTAAGIAFAWLYGIVWATFPLVGFQEYTYEGRIHCSVNWLSKRPVDVAFSILIFIVSYCIPIAVMSYCYGFIFLTVRQSTKKFGGGDDEASRKKQANEKKLAINLALTMVLYMIVWSPYAIVVLWGLMGDPHLIPVAARSIPGVFAKASMVVNPLLYVGLNKGHRTKVRRFLGIPVAVAPDDE